jgi:hypothetical protein
MGLLGAAAIAAPGLAHGQPGDLFYERTVMIAADTRCGLFTPDVASALAAGAAQARGAALRGGARPEDLRNLEQVARRKAALVGCGSHDVALAAGRVRTAFAGFARLTRLSYPGDLAGWRADRTDGREARWRLNQETAFGPDRMSFGLVGRGGGSALMAIGRFADGASPYAARLLLRDDGRSVGAYLVRPVDGPTRRLPLESRLPPRGALKAYVADARSPAGQDLLPKGEHSGWAFRFPPEAAQALAQLDPREAVVVEFLFPGEGEPVRRAYVEVGDFAAGRAFVQIAQR